MLSSFPVVRCLRRNHCARTIATFCGVEVDPAFTEATTQTTASRPQTSACDEDATADVCSATNVGGKRGGPTDNLNGANLAPADEHGVLAALVGVESKAELDEWFGNTYRQTWQHRKAQALSLPHATSWTRSSSGPGADPIFSAPLVDLKNDPLVRAGFLTPQSVEFDTMMEGLAALDSRAALKHTTSIKPEGTASASLKRKLKDGPSAVRSWMHQVGEMGLADVSSLFVRPRHG
jgi:hypothetical protein